MLEICSRLRSLSVAEKPSQCTRLPKELMVEIMSWLPPKSLIRSKCVSKSWYALISALISDPTFVAKHLHNSKILSFSSFIFGPWDATERFSLLTIFGYDDDDDDRIRYSTEVLNFPIDPAKRISSLSYCDGIFFIALGSFTVEGVLFNPAIKESRVLPKPCFADSFLRMGMGFGYDHRANDYKVVTFGFVRHDDEGRAKVYSMATDSWREIEMQIQINGAFSGAEVYCKGVFYWRMADYNHMILSFDMSDEVFRRIPLPNKLQELAIDLDIELAVWNGSAAFFYFPDETEDPTLIEVFVMNDRVDDARGSCYWVKHLTIGPFEGIARPWIFWKNDELLMVREIFMFRKGTEGWLVSYNLRSKKIRDFPIQGERGTYFRFLYVGLLVSVQRRGQAQLQI